MSKNLGIKLTSVDFPLPDEPTIATISPLFTLSEILFRTVAFSYLKLTFLNSIHFLNNGSNDISEPTKNLLKTYFENNEKIKEDILIIKISNNIIYYRL